jgi:signal transduction histidine kinase
MPPEALVGSLRLSDGSWLNFIAPLVVFTPLWATPLFLVLMITTAVVALVAMWAVRRATRPLSILAAAAERFGREGDAAPVAEDGPREVRAAAVAFNRMQDRLKTMLAERMQMLAALSHDLRTPLTRLRLRAELIEDPEQLTRTLADLDDIKAMLDSTLAFAHDEARCEPAAAVDLAALAQTVCDEAEDAGGQVSYAGPDHLTFHGRPQILKRALANLVGNAVNYGGAARLSLQDLGEAVEIAVDDDGPGIPESELTKVFTPFYRLEGSRSRQTGGVGLGLTVVRTAAGQHGGTAVLANKPGGGLRATLRLPRGAGEPAPEAAVGEAVASGQRSG